MPSQRVVRTIKRKEEILRAAAEVMRKNGVLATRLQDVADYLGVAYTALYHYFPSRDHLAEEVLKGSIARRLDLLKTVQGETALDRLLAFCERALTEGRHLQVRVPLLLSLPEPHRSAVWRERDHLRDRLKALLEEGIAERSIRDCDALTVANALLVLLERFTIFDRWLFSDHIRNMPLSQVVKEICAALRRGILAGTGEPPRPSWSLQHPEELLSFDPMITPELARLDEILATATRHFNVEAASASVPRIAEDLGVSKTVIYQYVLDKQDLLFQCYLRGVQVVQMSHRLADDFGKDPLDVVLIHRHNLYSFHDSAVGPFVFLNAVGALKPQQQRLIAVRQRGLRDTSIERFTRAQASGTIRDDAVMDIVQPMFGQMLYGLPGWYHRDYHLDIEEVCWQTGLIPLVGLEAP